MVKRGAPKTRTYATTGKVERRRFVYKSHNLDFYYRPGTSDDSVLHEILSTHWYRRAKLGFDVLPGEHWLDLGANIGGFALYCWLHGATCTCYEPQEDNYSFLKRNFGKVPGFELFNFAVTHQKTLRVPWYRGRSPTDFARYTTDPTIYPVETIARLGSSPATKQATVANVFAGDVFPKRKCWDGVKMDIEAAEHALLDAKLVPRCHKLVLEYHIRKDPNMANFRRRMAILRKHFKIVHYAPSLDKGYPGDKYPGAFDRMVFCMKPR